MGGVCGLPTAGELKAVLKIASAVNGSGGGAVPSSYGTSVGLNFNVSGTVGNRENKAEYTILKLVHTYDRIKNELKSSVQVLGFKFSLY